MNFKPKAFFSATLALALTAGAATAHAEQWYFYVKNTTDAKMTGLFASENGKNWGRFDIGSGIAPGKTVKMNWDSSTDSQSCKQYLKATFSDGTEAKTAKIDFCNDLDEPVEFSE